MEAIPAAMSSFARLLATWFGCGLMPVAPGTFGSLGALAVAWPLIHYWGWPAWWFAPLAVAFLPLAIWSATQTARAAASKDPGLVVIDEVVGQWIALAGCLHLTAAGWLLAFCLFRVFDIWKPWPVRNLESLPEGTGIVADDCMAGVYAGVVLLLSGWFNFY
jgi:phosphatidylglycerophosphatase A